MVFILRHVYLCLYFTLCLHMSCFMSCLLVFVLHHVNISFFNVPLFYVMFTCVFILRLVYLCLCFTSCLHVSLHFTILGRTALCSVHQIHSSHCPDAHCWRPYMLIYKLIAMFYLYFGFFMPGGRLRVCHSHFRFSYVTRMLQQ